MSTLPPKPAHLIALAPGYTPRQVELDAQMVALGRPTLGIKAAVVAAACIKGDRKALEAHHAEVEAWEHAHDSKTEMRDGPCVCGAGVSCSNRWLELRAMARAEDARLYEERFGSEAYAREQMRTAGFEEALVGRAMKELSANACFTSTRDWLRDGTVWSLVLIGDPGCGKTQAATWAAYQLLTRNKFAPRCARCPKVSELPLYGGEAEEYRWRCASAGVLVLDDLGEGEQRNANRSAWRAWVDDVLTQRYAARKKTIITTNRSVPELSAWLSPRIADRLNEGIIISTGEQSMRAPPREPGSEG